MDKSMIPYKKIFSLFIGRDRIKAISLVVAIFVGAVLETLGVSLVAPFITLLGDPDVLSRNQAMSMIFKFTGAASYSQFLIYFGMSLLLFYILKNLFLSGLLYTQNRFVFGHMQRRSRELLDLYMRAPYSMHLQRNSAVLQRTINHDVMMLFQWVVLQSFILIGDIMVIGIIFLMLLFVEPFTTFLLVTVLGFSGILFMFFVRNKISRLGKIEQEHLGQMIKWINQGIGGVKEIKILGNESFFSKTFDKYCSSYARSRKTLQTLNEFPRFFLETVAVGSLVIMVMLFILQDRDMKSVLPILALFAAASFRLVPAASRAVRTSNWIRHHKPSLDVVLEDLKEFRAISEKPEFGPKISPFNKAKISFENEIQFENVLFRYEGGNSDVLKGMSFSIPKGSSVAFVGPSGSGKTTVIDLILGLINPTSGRVTADGRDIRESPAAWRRYFGYIPQSIFLSDDTIRRNIAFGLFDEDIEEIMVERAVELAQLGSFIKNLPKGLDTVIGERGVRLSGGQRQRIGVARALYNDPEILIMDEATSSLDHETEQAITASIERLAGKKTLILIAHRLTTVEKCDVLYYLKDGIIGEKGAFNDLLKIDDFQKFSGRDFI